MPQSRVQTSVTLFGNAPWGFRISGGKEFNQPLVVTRVTPGSLASRSGVQSGDVLIAINNQYVSNMTQDECEVSVKQAVGSLHLVLEKNAATVTELPGGQFKVDGDRSVYTAVKDTQQRISKFNRSAKPFGAPDVPSKAEKAEEKPAESKAGFKSVAFQPSAKSQAQTSLPTAARGEPDGVNAAAESMSKETQHAGSSHNRTPKGFNKGPAGAPRIVSAPVMNPDTAPVFDPNALKQAAAFKQGPMVMQGPGKSKLVHAQYNTPMGMYSNDNIIDSVQAQAKSLGVSLPGAQDDSSYTPDINSPVYKAVHQQSARRGGQTQSRSFKILSELVQDE